MDNVKPIKPTELQTTITELEQTIERLQAHNSRAWDAKRTVEIDLAFMVSKYHQSDRMYDRLYELVSDLIYACDEHRADAHDKLRDYIE